MKHNLVWLSVYALAMALLEAVVVVYLRQLHYPGDPLQVFPPRILGMIDLATEWSREIATVAMILAVALLAERRAVRVLAAFAYVFGLWDIGYYAWLKLILGWPIAWLEWDILFLIPWPWFGPWIAAAAIALLFTAWGGWVLAADAAPALDRAGVGALLIGAVLALFAFLEPAYPLLDEGPAAFNRYQPGEFRWGAYAAGLALMAGGFSWMIRSARHGRANRYAGATSKRIRRNN